MAVAYDAVSTSVNSATPVSFTHTPVGTPKGVIVFALIVGSNGDFITSISYGGVALTEVVKVGIAGSDYGNAQVWFLGSSIPTGAQTVSVVHSTGAEYNVRATCVTVTAASDTAVQDSDNTIASTSIANPSATLALGGVSSFCAIGFCSGQAATTGITPLSSWTSRQENTHSTGTTGTYTYDTVGTSDVTAGWTQTADLACATSIAVAEASSPTPTLDQSGFRWRNDDGVLSA